VRITQVETLYLTNEPRWLWILIHTDAGLVGLGETYVHVEPVKEVIEHIFAREFLIGREALSIEAIWRDLFNRVNYVGWGGAEIRAISAVDIALWDLLGQASGQPIYQLLGGACRERIRVYNTCGHEPGFDFMTNPDDLAADLLASGTRAMKIWPFDALAAASGGHYLSLPELKQGLVPLERIRQAVGDQIDIAVEFHGHWDVNCALRIAHALEALNVMWLEDLVQADNLEALEQLRRGTRLPLAVSERLYTRYQFLPLLQRGIPQVINPDVEWCGGITEARKIAALADTFQTPVAFHNYGGPVLNFATAHVAASIPNLMILETGRDLIARWTDDFITAQPQIVDGHLMLPQGAGLGVRLSERVLQHPNLIRTTVS
jgi:L-alanine-DL-glutamate epimerase-like enolase superfamily enzyme